MSTTETSQVEVTPAAGPVAALAPVVPRRALLRTTVLAVGVAIVASVALAAAAHARAAPGAASVPWWVLAAAFAGAELLVFHIEVRREAVSFSLSEVPLTLALFFAAPMALVVGRLVGEAVLLTVYERQQMRKVLTNLSVFMAECATALVVFQTLGGARDVTRPLAWLVALAAVLAADGVGLAVILVVMRWHGAPVEPARMIVTNVATGAINIAIAVLAAVLLDTSPAAIVLLAVVAAIAVVAYRGHSALVRRYSSLELLYEFTRLVSGTNDPEQVLASMLKETRRLLRADAAAILTLGETEPVSLWLASDSERAVERALPTRRLVSLVADGRATVIDRNERDPERLAMLRSLGVADCIVAPLVESSTLIGVLLVADRETEVSTFGADDGRIFETLANHAGVALENGRLINRLHEQARLHEHEALHDPLSALPNRVNFLQRLDVAIDAARGTGASIAVGLLDLDHFKEVNDTLGHHHGDLLLCEVADRLRTTVPASVVLARLGGDEFALFTTSASSSELRELGESIQSSFLRPFWVEGFGLEVGVSIGFARYPEHGTDSSTVLQRADVAMYDAKTSSTDRVELYDATRDVNSPRRLALAADLRAAIETRELTLHFQPKVRMHDGVVGGAEGLVRWRHGVFGNVPPDDFVPLAERTGLIHPFTDYVIECGVEQLRQWSVEGTGLGMALNLSTRNLLDASLPARVDRMLAAGRIDPTLLTFEVTETSVMTEADKALAVLHGLADLGVRLSIDDFGTGHSSLAYLQRLPVHEVKIDKAFVQRVTVDGNGRAIVASIVQLAHNLGLEVVAEGVEDAATWAALVALGCDFGQGYFLCRPIPAADLATWLAHGPFGVAGRCLA